MNRILTTALIVVGLFAIGYGIGTVAYDAAYTNATSQAYNRIQTQLVSEDSDLLTIINKYRVDNNRPALQHDAQLDKSAQVRADEIALAGRDYWKHTRPDGTQWQTAVYIFTNYPRGAENLAQCASSTKQTLETWELSPPHNSALLGDYQQAGVGRAWDNTNKCAVFALHLGGN
jgi:uncharacterized protein YkwD